MGWAEKNNPHSWYNLKRAQRDRAARHVDVPKKDDSVVFEFSFVDIFKNIRKYIWKRLK